MINLFYTFGWTQANTQQIHISFEIRGNTKDELQLDLAAWRPGRYEIANFAKNILSVEATDDSGKQLEILKTTKDSWIVKTPDVQTIRIKSIYYAAVLNAGSTYLDEEQLYVNPVNCCFFIPDRANEACQITLDIPSDYKVAIDLPSADVKFSYLSESFDRLADAPFIASKSLQHESFETMNHIFHLWFQGYVKPDFDLLIKDFKAFAEEQLQTMGKLPGKEYHFMFQILPTHFYHGVEHTYSTVCALGPGKSVFKAPLYDELLGVSSHELFHAWNVKTIRPKEMSPYNFKGENYSRLGWVYEGITTWYGDQFLLRSGVFDFTRYTKTFNEKLKRHFINYGRHNLSVADSSFDTWLDGYDTGIPHRKTSIYTEGSLIAFILDSRIRAYTKDSKSLDNLMQTLYADAKNGKSYSNEQLIEALDSLAPIDHAAFFASYIHGIADYEPLILEGLNRIGLDIELAKPFTAIEHAFGFRLKDSSASAEVLLVAPGSPAEKAGLSTGDQLVALNNRRFDVDLYEAEETVTIHVFSNEVIKVMLMQVDGNVWFVSRRLLINKNASASQKTAFKAWSKHELPQD
jgi:predicted metalloprotease with PDZ domain